MKKAFLLLILLLGLSALSAQEKGKFRVGVDLSIDNVLVQMYRGQTLIHQPIIDWVGKSYSLSLNYNLTGNMNIGLKYMNQTFGLFDNEAYNYTENSSFYDGSLLLVDYNYYFHRKGWKVSPFVEFGAGVLYFQTTHYYESNHLGTSTYEWGSSTFPRNTFCELVATGIEIHHIRLSLEYLLAIPTTIIDLKSGTGTMSGESWTDATSTQRIFINRLSLNIGFFIGGGSWKKTKLN